MSMAWLALFFVLHQRSYPIPDDECLAPWHAQMRRPILGSLGYASGALLGVVVLPTISLVVFVLIPLYYALTSEGLRSAQPGMNPSAASPSCRTSTRENNRPATDTAQLVSDST